MTQFSALAATDVLGDPLALAEALKKRLGGGVIAGDLDVLSP